MENRMQIFQNEEFGRIRTFVTEDGVPWFVGKDVVDNLGYQNGSRDINRHVAPEDRTKGMVFDGNQRKETILINESGLYSLILSSKLESAKRFKHWVTSEVLPSIRRHGAYMTDALLEQAAGKQAVDELVRLVTTNVLVYTSDDDYLAAVRVLLGDRLEQALKG